MEQELEKTRLGSFRVRSGRLMLSDPSYKAGTWCQSDVKGVKNGLWDAYISHGNMKGWGERIWKLCAVHEASGRLDDRLEICKEFDSLGVDSGQMGIFDYTSYCKSVSEKKFYDECCSHTLSRMGAGILDHGCVCESGFGDGIYDGIAYSYGNQVVKVEITFLQDEDWNGTDM